MGLVHDEIVTVPDDPTYPVGSDEWNENHLYDGGAAGDLLVLGAIHDGTRRLITHLAPSAFPAPGLDTQVIFNDGGVLAGDSAFTWNKTTDTLTVPKINNATSLVLTTPDNTVTLDGAGFYVDTAGDMVLESDSQINMMAPALTVTIEDDIAITSANGGIEINADVGGVSIGAGSDEINLDGAGTLAITVAATELSGSLQVTTRTGTPATMAAFTSGGVLTETALPTAGVTSIAGTANQITASAPTGAVTLSLPSAVTMPGSLTVTTRTGTPATVAVFTSGGVLAEDAALDVALGGTNISSYAVGDLLYASGATTLAKLADVATGSVLVSGGVGAAPAYAALSGLAVTALNTLVGAVTLAAGTNITLTPAGNTITIAASGGTGTVTHTGALTASALVVGNGSDDVKVLASLGTTTTVLHGNAAGLPTFGAVVLTTDVSGVLPVANGGTALSTTPTNGQLLIGNGTNYTLAALTAGTGISVTNGSGSITVTHAFSGCSATKAAVQTLTSGTETSINFDTEAFDVGGYHDTVTNNTRFTAPFTGKFLVIAGGDFAANATNVRYVILRVNGTTYVSPFTTGEIVTAGAGVGVTAQAVLALSSGDYVELRAFQNSGGNLDFTPRFQIACAGV